MFYTYFFYKRKCFIIVLTGMLVHHVRLIGMTVIVMIYPLMLQLKINDNNDNNNCYCFDGYRYYNRLMVIMLRF